MALYLMLLTEQQSTVKQLQSVLKPMYSMVQHCWNCHAWKVGCLEMLYKEVSFVNV